MDGHVKTLFFLTFGFFVLSCTSHIAMVPNYPFEKSLPSILSSHVPLTVPTHMAWRFNYILPGRRGDPPAFIDSAKMAAVFWLPSKA